MCMLLRAMIRASACVRWCVQVCVGPGVYLIECSVCFEIHIVKIT